MNETIQPTCIDCKGKVSTKKTTRCFPCFTIYKKGDKCYQYKDALPNCIDCSKKLNQYASKRCRICFYVHQRNTKQDILKKGINSREIECKYCKKKKFFHLSSTAKFCGIRCYAKFYVAENNPRYKGMLSYSKIIKRVRQLVQYNEQRSDCFKRDNFQCQFPNCDSTTTYIESHHIKPIKVIFKENKITGSADALKVKELWNLDNLITLCRDCHNHIQSKELHYMNLFNKINSLQQKHG